MKPAIGRSYALALIIALATSDQYSADADNRRVKQWKSKINESADPTDAEMSTYGNCTGGCFVRDEAKRVRIERIKEELLQKLQLSHPPNVTASDLPTVATSHLRGILDQWYHRHDPSDEAYDGADRIFRDARDADVRDSAQTERVYAFATEVPAWLGSSEDGRRTYFRFSPSTMNNKVDNAVLHFYLKQPTKAVNEVTTKVNVHLFTVDDESGSATDIVQKQYRKSFRHSGHWVSIELTNVVDKWFKNPASNFGLKLEAVFDGENLVAFPQSGEANGGKYTMYLAINTSVPRRRSKREAPKLDCEEKDNDTRCCRYPLVVDFESFGWDWVIAPKKYRANYCSGECPFQHLQRYVHTHLMQQANPKGNAGPCCYPTQMAPILMVYFNENKEVLVSKVPGMIVTRCGCA